MLYFTRMKITLPLVFETVHALALALWIGADAALMILASVGAATAPHLIVVRELAVIEYSAIVMISIQFLTRRRYKSSKALYVADGVRHLFTFAALILAAYIMNTVKDKSIGVMESSTTAYATAGCQIVLLTAVSAITIWLLAARVATAAAASAATAAPAPPVARQASVITGRVRKPGNKR
jgi:hypothetical protein